MSTNRQAHIRYLALDRCFRNLGKKYFIEDLNEACNRAIYEFTGKDEGVKKRQIYDDIRFMESDQGWSIPLEKLKEGKKTYYRYSNKDFTISKEPLTESEANQIKVTLSTLAKFKGMPQFEWIEEISARLASSFSLDNQVTPIIEFEQNQYLQGLEFISPLYNAIIFKKPIQVDYLSFKAEKPACYLISPYFLKQYNNRWFLFGWNHQENFLMNLALDRVQELQEQNIVPYIDNTKVDFNYYFEDLVGVTIPSNSTPEKVCLKVSKNLWPYLKTKPIHGSQKVLEDVGDYIRLELEVYRNWELENLIFSFGNEVIVETPIVLRDRILNKAKSLILNYQLPMQIGCTVVK